MKAKINATLTGFIIALILIAMFGSVFALLMGNLDTNMGG